jgi:hypothetical protein
MSYNTPTTLRTYLTQVAAGAPADAILQSVLDRSYDIVTGALGFEFAAWGVGVTTKDVRAGKGMWLLLPYHKAASVTLVYEINGRGTTGESTELESDWIEESDGRLFTEETWTEGVWYRVSAIWGYGPVPDSIEEVELECAVNIWRGRDASSWQSDTGAAGDGSFSFNRALTWAQRSIIDGIRNRYLGVVHG